MKLKIGNRLIGDEEPCFIIAEAGINHNGELDLAKRLIDVAKASGADAVKFQTFKTEALVSKNVDNANYAKRNLGKDISQMDMLKNYELKYEDFKDLKKYCDIKEIIFLSTPHSFDAIDFLENLVPAYKFGSGDITNMPALKYAAKFGKPMILGTGMASLNEVKSAIDVIRQVGNDKIIALHSTSNYPCPDNDVNLRALTTMQKELNCLIGYSDHTKHYLTPVLAVGMGAVVIEKHFTLDNSLMGPDHKASLEPDELGYMIKKIRNAEKLLGNADKKPTESEKRIMKHVRKSVIAKQSIKMGSFIDENMLIIKRPSGGIEPSDQDKLIGKKTKCNISKDEIVQWDMVE